MTRVAIVVVAALALTAGRAVADAPGATTPMPTPATPSTSTSTSTGSDYSVEIHAKHSPRRDRNLALLLSGAGTALAFAGYAIPGENYNTRSWIVGSMLLVTPSIGEWYAGQPFTIGQGLRVAGLALIALNSQYGDSSEYPGSIVTYLGVVALASGALYDISEASSAADDYNKRHLQLAPMALATPAGPALGVGLGGTF